jgi:hypothetical protein
VPEPLSGRNRCARKRAFALLLLQKRRWRHLQSLKLRAQSALLLQKNSNSVVGDGELRLEVRVLGGELVDALIGELQ